MRTLLIIPISIALCAALGAIGCRIAGIDPHFREMLFAAGVCLVAGELAMVPIVLTRGATQPAVVQAALAGTVIHLFGSAGLGGGLILAKSLKFGPPLAYWLLAFYWITLVVVVAGLVKAVKAAPAA